jgi:hypothetical protein
MTDTETVKYVIKVGNIGYYKYDEKTKVQTVVSSTASCSQYDCRNKAIEIKTRFGTHFAILNRGIKLSLISI